MLTIRQNLLETIHGGNPDRFVKQYEFMSPIMGKPWAHYKIEYGAPPIQDDWGVWQQWAEGQPGAFPLHDMEHRVIKDFEDWKEYVKRPEPRKTTAADWEPQIAQAEAVDRTQKFATAYMIPGMLERTHHLGEIQATMMGFYECPDEMHDLISYITEYELEFAECLCSYVHPDAVFHHDDWGTQISTFMAPEMFEEFYLEPYKQVYGYLHDHGVELIVHHSDSYCETLVPYMIEMGIDIWQGVMTTNNIPAMIEKYGGQISFMGGINSATIDRADWTPELIESEVRRACTEYGKLYFIPGASQGGPNSTFPGVYECVDEMIDKVSAEMF